MCGIAGWVSWSGDGPGPEAALAMARRIAHRGPDGLAAWRSPSGRCGLGHARLVVIDPAGGDQPMANENGRVQVVFNGEIYNHHELRRQLQDRGHHFVSRCDTEVLVHGWEEWGEELPGHLEGMFAFAVWDEDAGTLFLARDRAGQKPLFYRADVGGIAFASEMKALAALPGSTLTFDPATLPDYLVHGYQPADRTPYRHVRKVPPAHLVLASGRGEIARPRRWWRLDWTPRRVSRSQAVRELPRLLEGAVERRLESDVPLGAFLSGGVDSSLVVALMARLGVRPLRTFALGFADDPRYDETRYAELVAKRWGTEHTTFTVEAEALELLDDLVEHYDEPFGDSSAIPTWIVSRLTRDQVTVALTGDGGDELFAGYPRFLGARIAQALPAPLTAVGHGLSRLLPLHDDFRHPTRRVRRFFDAAGLPEAERTLRWIGYFADDRWRSLVRPEVLAQGAPEPEAWFRGILEDHGELSSLARQLALNFESYLPEDLLVKTDRTSMAHGLELRSPFLDRELMEWAAGLPDALRIRGRRLKAILVDACADLLPEPIRSRPKMGFGVPLPLWFRTRWRMRFEDEVLGADARCGEWLRTEDIARIWKEHQRQEADHAHALWALFTLERWFRIGPHVS